MIIVPSKKFIEIEGPELSTKLEGWFVLRAIRKSGLITREHTFRSVGPFHNLITNVGLDRFGDQPGANLYARCLVGLGTTPPNYTDTQLVNFLAAVSNSNPTTNTSSSGAPDYYARTTYKWTSAIGALGTNNLTEIGISPTTSNANLFSRELIRDSNGDPVAFPITSDEQLEVTYELRIYPNINDVLGSVSISGNTYNTTTRPLTVTSSSFWGPVGPGTGINAGIRDPSYFRAHTGGLVSITDSLGTITGNVGAASTVSLGAYTNGTYYRDTTCTWSITTGNGNLRTITINLGCASFQVYYDPFIPKTNTQVLVLSHRFSWARR